MSFILSNEKNLLTVKITGDIDHHASKELRCVLDREIDISKPKELIFDLTECEFMDSSGLGLILGRLRKCNECGCEFKLVNPGAKTQRILRMAGVDKILNIQSIEI